MKSRPAPHARRRLSLVQRVAWTSRVAQAERLSALDTSHPALIAVASLDNRMLTTPVSALVGLLVEEVSQLPVALVDAETTAQPLRGPLDARTGGDLFGLLEGSPVDLHRDRIEDFADQSGTVPLVTAQQGTSRRLTADDLNTLIPRVLHRWPTAVLDLPYTLDPSVISMGTALASHVLLVADRHHQDHEWLYKAGHQLTAPASEGRVTVVQVGGDLKDLPADSAAVPAINAMSTSKTRLVPSTGPEDLAMYHRLLARIYKQDG